MAWRCRKGEQGATRVFLRLIEPGGKPLGAALDLAPDTQPDHPEVVVAGDSMALVWQDVIEGDLQ